MLVEDKSAHLDALPALFLFGSWDMESGVWHTSRSTILLRVEALDEDNFLWAKIRFVVPSTSTVSKVLVAVMSMEYRVWGTHRCAASCFTASVSPLRFG
jgi:hypothetical protein